MAAFQHLAEHAVSIVTAFIRSLGVLVINPSEYDYLAWRVVTKKQPVLLKELGPEPVFMIVTKGVALPVFRSRRVLRDDVEREFVDRGYSNSLTTLTRGQPSAVQPLTG